MMPTNIARVRALLTVLSLLGACHGVAFGQQPIDTQAAIQELQVRMEALEAENRQLRASMDRLPSTLPVSTTNTELLNEAAIHNAVDNYLAEYNANNYAGDSGEDLSM